jgi:hypothetical protein
MKLVYLNYRLLIVEVHLGKVELKEILHSF